MMPMKEKPPILRQTLVSHLGLRLITNRTRGYPTKSQRNRMFTTHRACGIGQTVLATQTCGQNVRKMLDKNSGSAVLPRTCPTLKCSQMRGRRPRNQRRVSPVPTCPAFPASLARLA